mgnify:CR=1 FL=1
MKPPPICERSAEAVRTGARLRAARGVDHGGFGKRRGFDRCGLTEVRRTKQDTLGKERKRHFLNIDVLCTVSSLRVAGGSMQRRLHATNYKSKPHRFGKQKRPFRFTTSPIRARFWPVAFIFE